MRVDSPERDRLGSALAISGFAVRTTDSGIVVTGATGEQVGRVALEANIVLSLLAVEKAGLEDVVLELVGGEEVAA